ncbi:hypothetical protein G3M83_07340 [Rouxiella badensis]|uniref:DUF4376 domain-containing protein n=1 Tax=Rouxiella badensis TaxID=1646377 RepID=UPI0013EF552A|nr:hypothetical protein [Rouxiella badensis]QII37523.1 hypothetical protein G3M83_07340 [Rouxiella badensis]
MKFITVGSDGNITGMYLTDPGNGVAVSDDDWTSIGPGYKCIDGKIIEPAIASGQEQLDAAKAEKISNLSAKCQAFLYNGFTSAAIGEIRNYPSTVKDQQNLASVAATGASASLWCENNSVWLLTEHTSQQISQVNADWVLYLNAAQRKLMGLVTKVNNMTTIDSVKAIDWI